VHLVAKSIRHLHQPCKHKLIFVFHNLRAGDCFHPAKKFFCPAFRRVGHKLIAVSIKHRSFRRHFADVSAT
jgi:hypothetical protein